METSKRIEYIDFIKGVCIFLVVWGHTIQNMGNGVDFWENPIHKFICSFHMPIFMLVSGFFFGREIGKGLMEVTLKKFKQLIVPCFGWSLVLIILTTIYLWCEGSSISPIERLRTLILETGTRFWFLRSVFICYVLATVSTKVFRNDKTACIVSIILFLLLPDNGRIHLDKFMYPFFWMGYFMHKHIDLILKHRTSILIGAFALFAILLAYWEKEHYIYITGMSFYENTNGYFIMSEPLKQLSIVGYRYLIGAAGSLTLFLLLQRIYCPHYQIIEQVGTYTLGIYAIHLIIEGNVLSHFDLTDYNSVLYNFVITPIISVCLIALCVAIIYILRKNRYTSFLFLGKPINS